MKVCFLSKMYPPISGGSGMYAYEIANSLAELGHDIDVYAQSTEDDRTVNVHENVSIYTVAKARRYLVTFETFYYSVQARFNVDFSNYDIIHGTLMPASPIALSLFPPSTPLVVTSHGTSLGEVRSHKLEVPTDYLKKFFFHPTNVAMDMATIPRVDKTIAISRDSANELDRWYPTNENDIIHIPHGVDSSKFHPDRATHSMPDPDRLTLLHVGRLVSRKHVDLALRALAALDRTDVELLVAGTGTHKERLETLAERLDVTNQITFLGYVPEDELPSLYASSDAFLFLSRYEGFGLTFLEAMASGTPVIGTPVGGFPDMVTDGTEGYLVDRDPKAVARSVGKMADSPELVAKMSAKARILAEERSWKTVATETEDVYKKVIE